MGIVTPPRGSKGRPPILNGSSGGGAPAAPGNPSAPPRGHGGRPALVNGGSGGSLPGYGSLAGGPYQPTQPPRSSGGSKSAPLH